MARNSAINLDVRNHIAGFSLESVSGHKFEIANYDIKLIGQIDTEITLPAVAATELLAKSHFTAAGDILVGTAANAASILAKGATGQVLTATASGLAWSNPGEAIPVLVSAAISAENGVTYIADHATVRVEFELPVGEFGERFEIFNKGDAGFKIIQDATQVIHFLDVSTTLGETGYLESTSKYDSIELFCFGNGEYVVTKALGNLELV